jgi:peptide/nickel transport system substrate-binding protein
VDGGVLGLVGVAAGVEIGVRAWESMRSRCSRARRACSSVNPSVSASVSSGITERQRGLLREDRADLGGPQVVTYNIEPDAVWSDGTPIAVADLAAQWQALNGSDPEYRISVGTGCEDIASVQQGEDDKQAVVTFAHRYTDWQGLFDPLYPASTNSDPDVFNTGWIPQPQVTAGPFRLQDIDPTAQTITLERNPEWWGDPRFSTGSSTG